MHGHVCARTLAHSGPKAHAAIAASYPRQSVDAQTSAAPALQGNIHVGVIQYFHALHVQLEIIVQRDQFMMDRNVLKDISVQIQKHSIHALKGIIVHVELINQYHATQKIQGIIHLFQFH
jgi:hypothetical protein